MSRTSRKGDDGAQGRIRLESPYWHLSNPDRDLGLLRLVRRFPASVRPLISTVWQAAPRAATTVIVLQLASGLLATFGLLAARDVLEGLLSAGPTADRMLAALPALALVGLLFGTRAAIDTAVSFAQARIAPAVRRLAEERFLAASLGAELAAYDDPAFYDRLHRARDRGLPQLEQATTNLVELLGALLAVAAASGAMGVLHPVLLPVLALSVLPEAWAVLRTAQLRYRSMTRTVTLDRRVRMLSDLIARREAAAEVRACQAAPFLLDEYRQVADVLRDEQVSVGRAGARAQATGRLVASLAVGGTYALLGLLVYLGSVPLAAAGAAAIAIRLARNALTRVVRAANQLLEQGLYVADYRAFLVEAAQRSRTGGTRPAPRAPQEITLRDVSFRYPGAGSRRPALTSINLSIKAGESIALVGENGSGKTTLARILAGLYEPTSGELLWDGVPTRQFDPEEFADRVLMMQQEPVRWPNDARTNVRVGRHDRDDPDDVALRRAAVLAGADTVVETLPAGWDTLLSKYFQGGVELSGGQWQRMAVARGLFRDTPLLIWDEPTAPLDPAAEHAVYESLRTIAQGRTVVLITHRLASVRQVDRIYLLHEGAIAEQGSHDDLLAAEGRYARMYELQSRMFQASTLRADHPPVAATADLAGHPTRPGPRRGEPGWQR